MASGYDRRLGLSETLSIVVGRIIGSGIFGTPSLIMAAAGGVALFYGSWLLGGVVTILSALLFAELVAMVPRSGGPYVYLRLAYHPLVAFLRGWAMFFVSETASIVAVALIFASYSAGLLLEVWPEFALAGSTLLLLFKGLTAFALIWLLTVANCFGVFLSGILQDIFSAVKIGALLFIAVACFSANPDLSNFGGTVLLSEEMKVKILGSASAYGDSFLGGLAALFASLRYSFFAYSGWEGATYVAEEVRNPEKNLPRSLFLGIGAVMVLYLLVNTSYLLQLSPQRMVDHKAVAVEAMLGALGVIGAGLVAVAVMISTFGNVSTQVLVKSRTWHAMARDGLFFSFLKPLSSRYHSPNRSLMFQAIWASCLLALAVSSELFRADPQSDTLYGTIIDFFSFTSAAFNVMTFGSVWILRKKLPDLPRPFKVPVLPLILGLVLLVQGAFMLFTLMQAPVPSLIGAALTCSGLVYWYWCVDVERRKPMSHDQILSELEKKD